MEQISIDLLKDPYSVAKWDRLLQQSVQKLSKASTDQYLPTVRAVFDALLTIYPLLENYWLKYAHLEYELANFVESKAIYNRALRYVSYSPRVWLAYLEFCLVADPVCVSNCLQYLKLFESARSYVGFHYFSADFYKLYLEFLSTYKNIDPTLNFQLKYERLLRYVLEVPMYNYSPFFTSMFDLIDSGELTHTSDKGLRKNITDIYVITQYKAFKLYDFEKKLHPYFDLKPIAINELKTWEKYMAYLELNYPHEYVIQAYERSVLATCNYNDLWLKYMNYLTNLNKLDSLNEVLKRAISLRKFNKKELIDRLIDLNLFNSNFLVSKNLLSTQVSINKLTSLEWLFGNTAVITRLFESSQPWELLVYHQLDNDTKLKLFKSCKNETKEYRQVLRFWLKYNPQYRNQFKTITDTTANDFDEELTAFL
ncbi:mRNA splicing protein [Yamadazyma tenuis]|uniref:Pre-mRNA-processing factor 39 n=1 Tax=Candida tenuis (strain ATCC 10573 / BCRC 21748 / CBS 615 / JCM 9827 / NBRC 10315 / NRRL Y-1498 / VKM Y-70) TaxID=590646 RepID=G3B5V7_CANTC|nr:uncharacterized protein CANTEDRAFT_114610 [Yamadazyma tenuis ATCC 10573]EGV63315.1 hypothetical protein CANTEDRAFT_114610 [Yamadazyma tenuis ATCC 10573]WEJ96866.1 mRNA splicing protein [Yamadazyma tenuis]